ncbi:hypothetical protein OIU78_008541 [Salix suchowensis]|nr:hypothetical protein OIU78_008541 [Salix suchowensis]
MRQRTLNSFHRRRNTDNSSSQRKINSIIVSQSQNKIHKAAEEVDITRQIPVQDKSIHQHQSF